MLRIAIVYNFDDKNWLGGRNYFSSLFNAVEAAAPGEVQFLLVTGKKTVTTLPAQFPALQVLRTDMLDSRSLLWTARHAGRLATGMAGDPVLLRFLRQHGVDILTHSGGLGRGASVKSLGWLPDFQFMQFPEYWTARQLRDTRRLYNSTCRGADALVLSSRSARLDSDLFAPWCKVPKHVLHFISQPVQIEKLRDRSQLLAQYELPTRYFHLPNQFWAHKNHRVVIEALSMLKRAGVEMTVACTGQTTDVRRPAHFQELMQYCETMGVATNFKVLGLVPYADMQSLMLHAEGVINPSRFEGWSTTVEEAKTLGKRTLLSDIPVHREQAPEGAVYFSPEKPEQLAALMRETTDAPWPPLDASQVEFRHSQNLRTFGENYMDILRQL